MAGADISKAFMDETLGKSIDRADARLKVTGAARYTAEIKAERTAFAVFVPSRVAKGKIKTIDIESAEHSPGVLAV